jgi:hypothetical protein
LPSFLPQFSFVFRCSQHYVTEYLPVELADGQRVFDAPHQSWPRHFMIQKLKSGQYRLYSRKKNPKTGRRRNLGTFGTKKAAQAHERAVQYFKHH